VDILICGAGAMGSLMGLHLSRHADVTLMGRNREHITSITRDGLEVLSHPTFSGRTRLHAVSAPEGGHYDIIIVTVKSYDTAQALDDLSRAKVTSETIISLQNGLTQLEAVRTGWKGPYHFSTSSFGCSITGPGTIRFGGYGSTTFDEQVPSDIIQLFDISGLSPQVVRDMEDALWEKAILNSCINTICTLLHCRNGGLLDQGLIDIVNSVVSEGTSVARANGRSISDDLPTRVLQVIQSTRDNINSMTMDVLRRKGTEISDICGHIHDIGVQTGKSTPYNDLMLEMIGSFVP